MQVPLDFIVGRIRVHIGELWPRDRFHFGSGVEFHRARSKRNHGAVKRQVFIGQSAQIAQHLMFGLT